MVKRIRKSKLFFSWHHWCGLVVGIFLLIVSISGTTLVFTREIEEIYEKPWVQIDNSDGLYFYDSSFFTVQKLYPGWEIRISGEPEANKAIVYDLRRNGKIIKVFAHPHSGAILHISDGVQNQLQQKILRLHQTLFLGTTGKVIVVLIGILFFISLITGIYIYRKYLIKVVLFKVRLKSKNYYSSLHRILGVWSLLFNLLIVVTGLFISVNIILTRFNKVASKVKEINPVIFSIDRMKKEIQDDHLNFSIYFIRVPAASGKVQFSGKFKSDPFYYGKYNSRFTYDGITGELESMQSLREQGWWKKWNALIYPLHFANYGGLPLKLLYCFLGLMPGFLSISGFVIWKKKQTGKKNGNNA